MDDNELNRLLYCAYEAGVNVGYYGDDRNDLKKEHGYSCFLEWLELNKDKIKELNNG